MPTWHRRIASHFGVKTKNNLKMFEDFFSGGTRWVSGMSEALSCQHFGIQVGKGSFWELQSWNGAFTPKAYRLGTRSTCSYGYRPNFRDSSSTVSSVCQYTKICLHQQVRLISMVHHYLPLQPCASLINTTRIKEGLFGNGPLSVCPYCPQKPQSHWPRRLTAVGGGLDPLQKFCLLSSQKKMRPLDYSIFCNSKLKAQGNM